MEPKSEQFKRLEKCVLDALGINVGDSLLIDTDDKCYIAEVAGIRLTCDNSNNDEERTKIKSLKVFGDPGV